MDDKTNPFIDPLLDPLAVLHRHLVDGIEIRSRSKAAALIESARREIESNRREVQNLRHALEMAIGLGLDLGLTDIEEGAIRDQAAGRSDGGPGDQGSGRAG